MAADAPGSELAEGGPSDTPDDIPNAAAEVSTGSATCVEREVRLAGTPWVRYGSTRPYLKYCQTYGKGESTLICHAMDRSIDPFNPSNKTLHSTNRTPHRSTSTAARAGRKSVGLRPCSPPSPTTFGAPRPAAGPAAAASCSGGWGLPPSWGAWAGSPSWPWGCTRN